MIRTRWHLFLQPKIRASNLSEGSIRLQQVHSFAGKFIEMKSSFLNFTSNQWDPGTHSNTFSSTVVQLFWLKSGTHQAALTPSLGASLHTRWHNMISITLQLTLTDFDIQLKLIGAREMMASGKRLKREGVRLSSAKPSLWNHRDTFYSQNPSWHLQQKARKLDDLGMLGQTRGYFCVSG